MVLEAPQPLPSLCFQHGHPSCQMHQLPLHPVCMCTHRHSPHTRRACCRVHASPSSSPETHMPCPSTTCPRHQSQDHFRMVVKPMFVDVFRDRGETVGEHAVPCSNVPCPAVLCRTVLCHANLQPAPTSAFPIAQSIAELSPRMTMDITIFSMTLSQHHWHRPLFTWHATFPQACCPRPPCPAPSPRRR